MGETSSSNQDMNGEYLAEKENSKLKQELEKINIELDSTIYQYKEKLSILEETNKSLYIDLEIYNNKFIETSIEIKEMLNTYNDIKQRNIELNELYNIKSRMNKNTGIMIAKLSSQINIKNEDVEKAKKEVNEYKGMVVEYRESNKTLHSKLKDKDIYIDKLIREICERCYAVTRNAK